jgi:hypothetical protein
MGGRKIMGFCARPFKPFKMEGSMAPATSINEPQPLEEVSPIEHPEQPQQQLVYVFVPGIGWTWAVKPEQQPTGASNPMDFTFAEPAEGKRKGGQAPPTLDAIEPDGLPIGKTAAFDLTVIGEGFTNRSIVVFDDEELPTTYITSRRLIVHPAMAASPGEVDVEVHDGEEMSDVLTFEFADSAGRKRSKPVRKPKKAEPMYKRAKKGRR